MELQLTSKRHARAIAVQLITASGSIVGAGLDLEALNKLYNSLISVGLKEKSDNDTLDTDAKIMAYSADRLLELNHASGLTITDKNLMLVYNFIKTGQY